MYSNTMKILIYTVLIFSIVLITINSDIVGNLYSQLSSKFADYTVVMDYLECHSLGINLYVTEELICNGKTVITFAYGHALLFLPYNDVLSVFYNKYLPLIIIFLFIFLTIKIINPQNKIEKLLLFLILLHNLLRTFVYLFLI